MVELVGLGSVSIWSDCWQFDIERRPWCLIQLWVVFFSYSVGGNYQEMEGLMLMMVNQNFFQHQKCQSFTICVVFMPNNHFLRINSLQTKWLLIRVFFFFSPLLNRCFRDSQCKTLHLKRIENCHRRFYSSQLNWGGWKFWLSSMAIAWKEITEFWSTTVLRIIASHKLSLVNT